MVDPLADVSRHDVVFTSPGTSDRSSIPLGNGELCASVWVDRRGLHFYLGRSDALSELDRTLKLGCHTVELSPNPFDAPDDFEQRLDLVEGRLVVVAEKAEVRVTAQMHIDIEDDDAFLHISSTAPLDAFVSSSSWRTRRRSSVEAAPLLWGDEDPALLPRLAAVHESADTVGREGDGVFVMHANEDTLVPSIAAMHGLDPDRVDIPDLVRGRAFGTLLTVEGHSPAGEDRFALTQERTLDIRVSTFSSQTERGPDALRRLHDRPHRSAASRARTSAHWREYWGRSWITVEGDTPRQIVATAELAASAASHGEAARAASRASAVTRAYVLTKWMHACGNRGRMPLLYNGGLHTVMPGGGEHLGLSSFPRVFAAAPDGPPSPELNPDERTWSVENLWQNLRLPYYSVLARGEPEALLPVFDYYGRFHDLNRARARVHHGADGQWSTEMTLSCGLQSPAVFGADRSGLAPGRSRNRWGGSIDLSPGLELATLMLEYFHFTRDEEFLRNRAVPYAMDLLRFARSRFEADGRLEIGPVHSVETYFDTVDPLPVVAGYRRVTDELLDLPERLVPERDFVQEFGAALPALPRVDDRVDAALAPARIYEDRRMNVESPELYAIYPFAVRGVEDAVLQATWDRCLQVSGAYRPAVLGEQVGTASFAGWQYLGPAAARLGRMREAADILEHNSTLSNPGFAFPAMWGPVYDAVPDVDHGANILNTLQEIVQAIVRRPELAANLPPTWRLQFRIFEPDGRAMSGTITGGILHVGV